MAVIYHIWKTVGQVTFCGRKASPWGWTVSEYRNRVREPGYGRFTRACAICAPRVPKKGE